VVAILAALAFTHAISAETKLKPSLAEALVQARGALVLADSGFSGEGAETLKAAVRESRFVLLGEDHFSREIPRFASMLCDIMKPDAFAVEAGPEAAAFVNGLLRDGARKERVAKRMHAHPNSMAFLDAIEESDSAAHCATASRNPAFALWGLDQEFLGATGTVLEAMAATSPGEQSRAAIAALRSRSDIAQSQAKNSGDPGKAFLLSATEADLKPLVEAVAVDGNAGTRALLDELLVSHKIYRLNAEGSPDSNRIRAELFKQHFLTAYTALGREISKPRVLFKFGDNHSGKGFSPLQVRDIGNFVAELADGEKAHSLHIKILGVRGKHGIFGGFAKPLKDEPFVITEYPEYQWLESAVAKLLPPDGHAAGTTWTLFDLRKLRFRGIDLSPEWKRTVYGYDLLVLVPELTSATLIQ
jgi:hypothetical protein